jgi:hypothetical protein
MKSGIPFLKNKIAWLAIGLMVLQFIVKVVVEIGKAAETGNPGVVAVAVAWTIGWVGIIAACIGGLRLGYWLGAVLGIMHFVLTAALPLTGACDHYLFAAVVMSHGILIAAACLTVLLIDALMRGANPYNKMTKPEILGFVILCVSVLVRTLWITFREPVGAAAALAAAAGKGGLREFAAGTLIYVVGISMVSLCAIIPGVVIRKRWAYLAAAIFGGIHAVLTILTVMLHVNQGFGPAIVIPASLGMLIGGWCMLRTRPDQK